MYNILNLIELPLLSILVLVSLHKKLRNFRLVMIVISIINIFQLIQFLIISLNPKLYIFTTLFLLCLLIPYVLGFIFNNVEHKSDEYNHEDCFKVYRKPTDLLSFLFSFLVSPYGHCYLLVQGKKFSFKNGEVIERDFEGANYKLIFKKINPISLVEARKLLGIKWSIKNNCFAVFNKYV